MAELCRSFIKCETLECIVENEVIYQTFLKSLKTGTDSNVQVVFDATLLVACLKDIRIIHNAKAPPLQVWSFHRRATRTCSCTI